MACTAARRFPCACPGVTRTGIWFRRTDLDGFEIEAVGLNVARVSYATSLMKKGVLISTTEHFFPRSLDAGIDNAIVELDNLELPNSRRQRPAFVEMIQKAGIRKQRRPRKYLKIRRELEMREGNKFIAVYPAENYSVSYSINFPASADRKRNLSGRALQRQLSSARLRRRARFGSREDERAMRNMGLIRGASRENCIVLTQATESRTDLFVSATNSSATRSSIWSATWRCWGNRFWARSSPTAPGHAMHTALVSRILRDKSLWEEVTLPEQEHDSAGSYSGHASAGPTL